ncbi:hypothetical protein ACWEWX_40970, partial [Streptomyces asiaticus]
MLVGDFLGISGRVDFDAADAEIGLARLSFTNRGTPPTPHRAVRRPAPDASLRPMETGPGEHLLLSGPVTRPAADGWQR